MIHSVTLKNFKSFTDETIKLRPLTLLCGLNNSGKSSVLQALRMYCKSRNSSDPLLAGYGSVDELRSKLVLPTEPIVVQCKFDGEATEELKILDTKFTAPLNAPLCSYLGADRWGPKASLPIDRAINELPIMGDHGEYVVAFLDKLRNLLVPGILHHKNSPGTTVEYELGGWLSEIAPGVKLTYAMDFKRDTAHTEFDSHRPTNMGFGLSYSLPILALILGLAATSPAKGWDVEWGPTWDLQRRSRGLLILIENPEGHLHPRGQTALGRLIALGARAGLQLVVETQSDHLMDGIRIAIKEEALPPYHAVFHYLSRQEDGRTQIQSPEVLENGKLTFWPDGFFDQTLRNRSILAR